MSRKDKTKDVIRHIITMYQRRSDLHNESPLQFPDNPEAYELRLIDDDEDFYIPFYEISALENEEPVGDFQALAFCKRKGFKSPKKEESKNAPGTSARGDHQNLEKISKESNVRRAADRAARAPESERGARRVLEPVEDHRRARGDAVRRCLLYTSDAADE